VTGRRTWYDLIGDYFTDDDLPGFHDLQYGWRSIRRGAASPSPACTAARGLT
jgi:hypothetical protein